MHWRVKGLVQKVLSVTPMGERINDSLQRTLGGLCNFNANVDSKVIDDWLVLMSHMKELHTPPNDLDYMEIGTGWYPTLPTCYSLAGARSCKTFDISRHLDAKLTFKMVNRLQYHLPAIASAGMLPLEQVELAFSDLVQAGTVGELLRRGRIEYLAPADAVHTKLPAGTIDVVFSNSVLEHVPRETIRGLMWEAFRVLRPGGLPIHSVNCGDHYAYLDRKITPINYRAYGDRGWRLWDNRLLYQNRPRPQDFLDLAREAGLTVVLCQYKPCGPSCSRCCRN